MSRPAHSIIYTIYTHGLRLDLFENTVNNNFITKINNNNATSLH